MIATVIKVLWKDERAAVVSAELAAVMTCSVLALIVGLKNVSDAVNTELSDLAQAMGSLNQSYSFSGMIGCQAWVAGSSFVDTTDSCECTPLLPVCPTPESNEHIVPDPQEAVPSTEPMPTPMQEGPEFPLGYPAKSQTDIRHI